MSNYRNILIVRTDRVGDVVLTTPAIKALKLGWPEAKISILLAPATRDLVVGNPYLDEILVDDRQGIHRGPFGFLKLVTSLRRQKFDLAVIYHTKKRTNLACFLAGIPRRTGYRNNKFGFLLTDPIPDERPRGRKHEAQYCLDVLRHLGVPAEEICNRSPETLIEDVYVAVTPQARDWAQRFCRNNGIRDDERLIAIHPGASDPAKQWPPAQFAELIDQLSSRHSTPVMMIGTGHAAEAVRQILPRVRAPVINLTNKTTVGQMAALLQRCRVLVSNDSGPVHVAAGVGVPVVSIFTRDQPGINPERWQPLGKISRVVRALPSSATAGAKSTEAIPTQAVLEAVDAIFKLC